MTTRTSAIWTPPSRMSEVVLPPSRMSEVVLPPSRVPRIEVPATLPPDLTEHVHIDLLSDRSATAERFHVIGFKWEPGDEEVTWIDEDVP